MPILDDFGKKGGFVIGPKNPARLLAVTCHAKRISPHFDPTKELLFEAVNETAKRA